MLVHHKKEEPTIQKSIDITTMTDLTISCRPQSYAPTVHVTVPDPLKLTRQLLNAYGLYTHTEEGTDTRVHLEETSGGRRLVIQENISHHGSPLWDIKSVITEDPARIDAYLAARQVLRYMKAMNVETGGNP